MDRYCFDNTEWQTNRQNAIIERNGYIVLNNNNNNRDTEQG